MRDGIGCRPPVLERAVDPGGKPVPDIALPLAQELDAGQQLVVREPIQIMMHVPPPRVHPPVLGSRAVYRALSVTGHATVSCAAAGER